MLDLSELQFLICGVKIMSAKKILYAQHIASAQQMSALRDAQKTKALIDHAWAFNLIEVDIQLHAY